MNVSARINQNASGNERKSTQREIAVLKKEKKITTTTQKHNNSDEIAIRFDAKTLWQICSLNAQPLI